MKKKILLLVTSAASLLGALAVTAPTALASSSCSGSSYLYVNTPSTGYATYGARVNCVYEISTYKLTTCLQYVSTGQNVPGSCHTSQNSVWGISYSVSAQYTMYLPGQTVRPVGSYYITFK